jgi:steroid 5-alpha reductase family enzyme
MSFFTAIAMIDITVMLCCWLYCQQQRRAGLVDAAWSFCIALTCLVAALVYHHAPISVRLLIGIGSTLWFARLTWHLSRRYFHETSEDERYASMRAAMGKFQRSGFLVFFLFQAGLAFLFSLPMLLILSADSSMWSDGVALAVIVSAVIMLCALVGESIADQQLYQFKQNTSNQGKTLDTGLWRYSRHPNYFFEWLHWFAYPLVGWWAGLTVLWFYPLLMFLFLYFFTGIPFSEQQALRHRGDNYRRYQQCTSMFFPWKPKA